MPTAVGSEMIQVENGLGRVITIAVTILVSMRMIRPR